MIFLPTRLFKKQGFLWVNFGEQKGQSLIIFVFAFLGLIAMLGLALDLGLVYIERTRIKRAVDAGTLAGVVQLPSEEHAYLRAITYLDQNGYKLRNAGGNPQLNIYIRGCAQSGYLNTTGVYTNYYEAGRIPANRIKVTNGLTYYLYFPPAPTAAVADPIAEFFIDTRSYQSKSSNNIDFAPDDQQCNAPKSIYGTAGKLEINGNVPVRMNFMQFFGFSRVPVADASVAQNVTSLDVVVVFDASGSMQFDTSCFGCYEPYGDGGVSWKTMDIAYTYPISGYVNRIPISHLPKTYQDGSPNVAGTNNLGQLCWNRDSGNQPTYYTVAGTPTKYYVVIEGELYSLNTSVLAGPLRQPGRGYWAAQNATNRVIYRTQGDTSDRDNTFVTGATPISGTSNYRPSWVAHQPYVSWSIAGTVPFGHDYTLTEARNAPNDVPSLEYDFITKSDWGTTANPDDTRIWVRVQANRSYADTKNLYWAVYRYSDLYAAGVDGDVTQVTPLGATGKIEQLPSANLPKGGSAYGGADGDWWAWRQLNSSTLNLDNGQRYTLKLWAGGPGVGVDQIVIGNQNSASFTTDADFGSTTLKATAGSAFRQACNHCNPIYGLKITTMAECLPPKDNGANTVPGNNYDLADPLNNPLYSGYQPIQGAKEAVKRFIGQLNPQFDQAGLVTYSSDTHPEGQVELRCKRKESAATCFMGANPITYTQVLKALERVPPYGSTNMAKGMRKGLEVLGVNVDSVGGFDDTCVDATDHCSRGGAARRVMIVMTDGVANVSPGGACATAANAGLYPPTNWTGDTDDIALDCVIYYAQKARQSDVTIYVIGLGNGVDFGLLQAVANAGQGQFFAAASPAQLDAIFSTILKSVSVRLIQ